MKVLSPFLLLVLFRFGHSLSLRYGCVWRTFSASIVNTGGVNESPGMVNVMERTTDGVNNHNNSSSSAETADEHLGNLDSPVDDADDKYLTELMKLGWSPKECASALATAQGDISKAVEILQDQDEYRDHLDQLSSNITISFGWNIEAALIALEECNGNVEDALARLQKEEDDIKHYFESNVADMVESGWDEVIARQALVAQWDLDQQKARGLNISIPKDVLENIRPTLKVQNNSYTERTQPTIDKSEISKTSTPQNSPERKQVSVEDVVFEVTSSDFQKVVLESPVPVLLDIYADWCGPCKQLGPMLEDIAVKANGMFRLVKVNSDRERQLVDSLNIKGLPTVFAVSQGKIIDRFVGIIDGKDIQSFIMHAITGQGKSYAAKKENLTDDDFKKVTMKVSTIAGMSSIGFKKKERLRQLAEEALQWPDSFVADATGKLRPHPAIKAALQYIKNAADNIQDQKFCCIRKENKVYSTVIANSLSGVKLLESAGFRDNDDNSLQLIHKNTALLNIIHQRANELIDEKRFSKTSATNKASQSSQQPSPSVSFPLLQPNSEPQVVDKTIDRAEVMVSFRGRLIENGAIVQKSVSVPKHTTLATALELLPLSFADFPGFKLVKSHPAPICVLTPHSMELRSPLESLDNDSSCVMLTTQPVYTIKNPRKPQENNRKAKQAKSHRKKLNTLSSLGILSSADKKHNEYFGGDSTVVSSGEEE